jgi:hypothetical protein
MELGFQERFGGGTLNAQQSRFYIKRYPICLCKPSFNTVLLITIAAVATGGLSKFYLSGCEQHHLAQSSSAIIATESMYQLRLYCGPYYG